MYEQRTVRQTIDDLYDVFDDCRPSETVKGCTHCIKESETKELITTPLRELSDEQISLVGWNLLYTWGSQTEFRYFLPRLLDSAVRNEQPDPATVLARLHDCKWHSWDEDERIALESFVTAWWLDGLNILEYDAAVVFERLEAIAQAVDDLQPYLIQWKKLERRPRAIHAAQFLLFSDEYLSTKNPLVLAFWKDREVHFIRVLAWMRSNGMIEIVREHLNDPLLVHWAARIEIACSLLAGDGPWASKSNAQQAE